MHIILNLFLELIVNNVHIYKVVRSSGLMTIHCITIIAINDYETGNYCTIKHNITYMI